MIQVGLQIHTVLAVMLQSVKYFGISTRYVIHICCDLQGILEALEFKLKRGWKPERTLYVAFGHDEEVIVLCCALIS